MRDREALACDSPDTLSETDSQASLRGRRKLPHLPPDQEAALLPSVQKKKLEMAKTQQQQQQQMAAVQERIKYVFGNPFFLFVLPHLFHMSNWGGLY